MFKKIIVFAIVFGLVAGLSGLASAYLFRVEIGGQATLIANSTNSAIQAKFFDSANNVTTAITFDNVLEAESNCEQFSMFNAGRVALVGAYGQETVTRLALCGGTTTIDGVEYDWGIPMLYATSEGISCLVQPELEVNQTAVYEMCVYYPLQAELQVNDVVIDILAEFDFETVQN